MSKDIRMATRLLLVVMASAATGVAAQQLPPDQVPAVVRSAWAATHQGAVTWHAAPGRSFDAWFDVRNSATREHYAADGTLLETRVEIGAITMPAAVRAAVVRDLRGVQLDQAWRVALAGGGTLYQVDGREGKQVVTARFGATGQLVSRTVTPGPP
jgi:hypothetical protein